MKKSVSVCLVAFTACAFAHSPTSDFKTFMEGMVKKTAHAFETKDESFFDKIATPDFTENQGGHIVTRAQAMQMVHQQNTMSKSVKCHFKLLSAKVVGTKGVVTVDGAISMVVGGDPKKLHTISVNVWEQETWVKSGSGWKIKSIDAAKQSNMTYDGKPMGKGPGH